MNFESRWLTPNHADFVTLAEELSLALLRMTGDSGQRSFSPEEFDAERDGCLVVYVDKQPVACGVFRYFSANTCEFKRMYSKHSGAGSFVLGLLEASAVEKGYSDVLLSTRRVNCKAVDFYRRHSYEEVAPFGRYVGVERFICMGKSLLIN